MKIGNVTKLPVLAEGGEGILYEYHDRVLKCYKPWVPAEAKRRKIQLLLSQRLPEEAVGPMEEVTDQKGKFIGFLMKKAVGAEFRMLSNKKFVSANRITIREILQMLLKIQEVLNRLHCQNIYVGDLNDRNLLFDSQYNVYFIDCDSWSVGEERCEVAMDLFQDPALTGNAFDERTDLYAFCILAFKALTRLHPFGGTMDPDLNLRERMQRGISVIDRPQVKLPRSIRSFRCLSPKLLEAFKRVFEQGERQLGTELLDLFSNLKYCTIHKEYYDGNYKACPLCDAGAGRIVRPLSQGVMDGRMLTPLWNREEITAVLNETTYIDKADQVTDVRTGQKVPYAPGRRYFFTGDGTLVTEDSGQFQVHKKETYVFEKRFQSAVQVEENRIYYLNRQNRLCEVSVYPQGNHVKNICSCGNTAYFEVHEEHYCVLSAYDGKLIFCIDGICCEVLHKDRILNYGMHHDPVKDLWLVVLEGNSGKLRTLILSGASLLYDADQIRYPCSPEHLCIYNGTIFFSMDGKIRGYAYQKDAWKDFLCEIVDTDSRLLRKGKGFYIINHENVYLLT